jgi:hypothetical protein
MVLCGLCVACANLHFVNRAETAYQQGRYLEAAESLARHEKEVDELTRDKRARYGLYRGLALMELGDPAAGKRWLYYARDVELEEPTLNDRQRQELQAGLTALVEP